MSRNEAPGEYPDDTRPAVGASELKKLLGGLRPLADLPNVDGFEFFGVDKEGAVLECVVGRDPVGCHSTYTKWSRDPCFFRLSGWLPVCEMTPNAELRREP